MTVNVFQVQHLLKKLGHDPGTIDGVWGPKSQAALDSALGTGDFWGEIRFFRREEFRCKCGGRYCAGYPAEPQEAMVLLAEAARAHFGRPARVISGLRCETWNKLQGGVAGSRHMTGKACDLNIPGVSGDSLLSWVKKQPAARYAYRIPGTENVHFDVE